MDLHGNTDLFDSLDKANAEKKKTESLKFAEKANEYALQGFEEDQVSELLQLDGCSREVSSELSVGACSGIPYKYTDNERPCIYNDVKDIVEATILNKDIDVIMKYFDKFADRRYASSSTRILVARDNPSRIYLEEVHNELRPLIEGLIIQPWIKFISFKIIFFFCDSTMFHTCKSFAFFTLIFT